MKEEGIQVFFSFRRPFLVGLPMWEVKDLLKKVFAVIKMIVATCFFTIAVDSCLFVQMQYVIMRERPMLIFAVARQLMEIKDVPLFTRTWI